MLLTGGHLRLLKKASVALNINAFRRMFAEIFKQSYSLLFYSFKTMHKQEINSKLFSAKFLPGFLDIILSETSNTRILLKNELSWKIIYIVFLIGLLQTYHSHHKNMKIKHHSSCLKAVRGVFKKLPEKQTVETKSFLFLVKMCFAFGGGIQYIYSSI